MPRYDYNRTFEPIPCDWGPNGEEVRIVVRLHVEAGSLVRVCVGLQVRVAGWDRFREIVRYDDSHGELPGEGPVFHRHAPGDPPRTDDREYLRHVERGSEVRYALKEIASNGQRYIAEAMAAGYVVRAEDEDSAE